MRRFSCLFSLALAVLIACSPAMAQEPARLFRDAPPERPLTAAPSLIEKGYTKALEAADSLAGAGESRHDEFAQQRPHPKRKKLPSKKGGGETGYAGPGYLYPPDNAYPPPVIAYDSPGTPSDGTAPITTPTATPNPNQDYEELHRRQYGNRRELTAYEKTIIFNQRPVY